MLNPQNSMFTVSEILVAVKSKSQFKVNRTSDGDIPIKIYTIWKIFIKIFELPNLTRHPLPTRINYISKLNT